jgi:hypothetical protein
MKTAPQNIVNQMAWGIAIKRFSGKKYKRRAWYARSSGGAINDLYNSVAAGMPDIVLQEIKAAFDQ